MGLLENLSFQQFMTTVNENEDFSLGHESGIFWTMNVLSSHRQKVDYSDGILRLSLTTTHQLYVLRDETEKLECVDLLSHDSSSIFATYTGDSLLISYQISNDNIQRKFLIKFASTMNLNGRQHCEECAKLLSRSITITNFDSLSSSPKPTIQPIENSNSIISMADMIKILMGDHSIQLPTYYKQEIDFDKNHSDEFVQKCLCDETFPDFVANIASILNTMKET